jgi:hypothetical protein
MSRRPQDGAERLLDLATAGLPAHRRAWGAAMRAELAAIDDPAVRRRFARSAARAAFGRGLGLRLGLGLGTGGLVAAVTVTASRLQLPHGGPGVLPVTVPVPGFLLLLVTLLATGKTRSLRFGLETGILALAAGLAALWTVLAIEGQVWMDRLGVFILDADPPRGAVDRSDVILDLFTTGMWVGHLVLWVPAVLVGATLGALVGGQQAPTDVQGSPAQ